MVIFVGRRSEVMQTNTVSYTKKNRVAYITINRPEVENVISQQLVQELADISHRISCDDSIYVVVITGAGGKTFCGGSELEPSSQAGTTISPALPRTNAATVIASIAQPVIAAINGDVLGQGLELALSCDVRLASNKACFGFPQVSSGFIPMDGGTQRLPRLIGRGKALELILAAETISAEEALEIGLVTQVVLQENLTAEVETLAQTIASKAPIALRYIKEAVNKGMDLTLEQGLRLEADLYFLLHTTADRTEGIKAFLEKRSPQFKGQ